MDFGQDKTFLLITGITFVRRMCYRFISFCQNPVGQADRLRYTHTQVSNFYKNVFVSCFPVEVTWSRRENKRILVSIPD